VINIKEYHFIVTVIDFFTLEKRSFNLTEICDRWIGAWVMVLLEAKEHLKEHESLEKIELIEVE
jgi:hypothetical protein